MWGRIDPSTGKPARSEDPAPGDVDLVDRALAEALLGGTGVHVVDADDLGPGTAMAVLRHF